MKSEYLLIATSYAGFTTYGIAYAEFDAGRPVLIETYPDLSFRKSQVERLVVYCNASSLPRPRLRENVERFVEAL